MFICNTFRKVKEISNKTLNNCIENLKHFKITSQPNKEEIRLYKLLVLKNENAKIDHNNMPLFGHFELWTSEESPHEYFYSWENGFVKYTTHRL